MTILQKTLIASTLFAAVSGTGVYEARQVSRLQRAARALQQEQAPVKEQIQRLRAEQAEATNRLAVLAEASRRWQASSNELAKLRSELVWLRRDSEQLKALRGLQGTEPQAAATVGWLDRVQRLKELLARTPDAVIPELASLTEEDWLLASARQPGPVSERERRSALSGLRLSAKVHYLEPMREAIREYAKANGGKWPAELAQITPYLKTPIDDAILQRYEVVPADTLPMANPMSGWVLTEKAPVDAEYDGRPMVGSEEATFISFKDSQNLVTLTRAIQAYCAANNGQLPTDVEPARLAPYARTAEEKAALASLTKDYETAPAVTQAYYLKLLRSLSPK